MASFTPIPLSLKPPNGACATDGRPSFRPIIPYSSASLIWNAWLMSFVKIYAAKPYGVLFARSITSSTF